MLTKAQEKLITSLQNKKARQASGLCLVEGKKVVEMAGRFVDFVFTAKDIKNFKKLVTTETPQDTAAVAKIPQWSDKDILAKKIIVVLDGVQDPGNVGAILRLCLGFSASLVLVESADPTAPKVVRSSVGALFAVPWQEIKRSDITSWLKKINRPIYRLEKRSGAKELKTINSRPLVLLAGSEGSGIKLAVAGQSVFIAHDKKLESLNVSQAVAIALYHLK